MAIPTTTITGTIVLPDGSAPYEATIEAEISQAGAYLDDGHSHLAIDSVHVHCPLGVIPTFALIPNDAITPAGTYYRVTIRTKETSTSIAVRNVVLWQVDSAPDPIDIGAVIRLDAVPGLAVGLPAYVAAYDMMLAFPGPFLASQWLGAIMAARPVTIPVNFAGSQGKPRVNPTATATVTVKDSAGATVGTISISTGGVVTFAAAAAISLAAGQYLDFFAQASPDATFADLRLVIVGTQS